ncbi:MAG: PQQ-binding-like beta-propeller repeat protein [Pseudomonadota bacterium]
MKIVRLVLLGVVVSALAACSIIPNPFRNEAREAEEAAERAGRVPLSIATEPLAADPDLAAVAVLLPDSEAASDWPQAGGLPEKTPGHLAAAERFAVDWRIGAGEGSSRTKRLVSPPVVADGKIFVIDAAQSVRAFDASTGSRIWALKLEPPRRRDRTAVGGGLAVGGDKLLVSSGFGYLIALSTADGSEIWRRRTDAPMSGAPAIQDGKAYVTSTNNEVYALDIDTGAVTWNDQAIAETARVLSSPSPAVSGDLMVAPFSSGELIAYLPANGRRLWSDALTTAGRFTPLSAINDIAGRPVISEGVVYAASQSGVLAAIEARSGTRIWVQPFGSIQAPAVVGGFIFIVGVDGQVVCLDKLDGRVVWAEQLPQFKNEKSRKNRIVWTGPLVVSNKIVLVSSEGQAVALSPQTGEIQSTLKIGDPVYIEPIAANGRVYVLTDDGRLVAIA